jgi:hypothetical protein
MGVIEAWYVGNLSLIHGWSTFDGEVVKNHKNQNQNHDSTKFQGFFKGNLVIHFSLFLLVFFVWNLFLVKFFKSIYCAMAPLKLPSNFKYKTLFGYRFLTLPQKLIVHELPHVEALNDLHVHFNLNVDSSSNIVTTRSIIKLE